MAKTLLRRRVDRALDGRSHASLAKQAGISKAFLSQILSGRRTPSIEIAVALAKHTGLSASDFLPALSKVAS